METQQRQELLLTKSSSSIQPTPRALFVASLGIFVAALPSVVDERTWSLSVAFWALFALVCGVEVLLLPSLRELSLSLPKQLSIGEREDALVSLRGLGDGRLEAKLDTSEPLSLSPSVRGQVEDGALVVRLPLLGLRRGQGALSSLWLRLLGAFGLFRRVVRFPLDTQLSILPNMPMVYRQALQFMSGRSSVAGPQIERFYGDGSEFDSLREFVPGLDARAIDWRSSARHIKLLSRQCIAERDRQVIIAVDTGHLMAEPLGALPRLDHALHAALLLSYIAARAGDRVGFFAFDERPRAYLAPVSGGRSVGAILQKASELSYFETETNFTLSLAELCTRATRRSLVIVLTEFIDTTSAELMIENIHRLARRHLVLFVALKDPQLRQELNRPPKTALDLHRAVVAESLQKERELVLLRLRRLGVLCLDALPTEIGPALVNRYLEVKRREML